MSIRIRKLVDGDFFPWLGLYEQYGQHYAAAIDDQVALRVWSWITDPAVPLDGLIAVDDEQLVGLAHYRGFVQPLTASRGVFVEDLFVVPTARQNGLGTILVEAVKAEASATGASILRLSARPDDEMANSVYGALATRSSGNEYEAAI
ncbi:GNAT family N-acetyltransferase [Microbacteriaceae bacterium VKM Ac-2855]|nr:GNAT family N-acetyltransferase [Microbacteriaceae bacterium VKM Ac-2855]